MNRKQQDFLTAFLVLLGLGALLGWAVNAGRINIDDRGYFGKAEAAFGALVEAVVLGVPETIEDEYADVEVPPRYDPAKDDLEAPAVRAKLKGAVPAPDYPAIAQRNGWEGYTLIHVIVDETGQPIDCRLVESSGHDVLDKAACVMIIEGARYTPARDGAGQPVMSGFKQGISWRLEE